MKTNIATAVLNISDANVAKNVLGDILKITPAAFQEFVTELLLGITYIPDVFPMTVTKNEKVLTFQRLFYEEMSVSYTFESQEVRFFASQEDADRAIKKRNRYSGDRTKSEEYSIEATITYTDSSQINLKEWLELAKQGE